MGARKLAKIYRIRLRGIFCIYCGELAQCYDHFPPYSATYSGFLLPACNECNALAGTEYPFEFESRARFVRERLEQKYKRVLDTPEWSKGELNKLGRGLKDSVKAWEELRKIVLRRIAWNAISYLSCTALTSDFARFVAEINTMPENAPAAFEKRLKSLQESGVFSE